MPSAEQQHAERAAAARSLPAAAISTSAPHDLHRIADAGDEPPVGLAGISQPTSHAPAHAGAGADAHHEPAHCVPSAGTSSE